MNKKKLFITLGIVLAVIIALVIVFSVLFAPRKLSGLVSSKGIVKIELVDEMYYSEGMAEPEQRTLVLDQSKHEAFINETRNTKYKNRYQKCKCVCSFKYIIYYESGAEIYFDDLRYYKKENGETVKYKDIDMETKNFYNFFS